MSVMPHVHRIVQLVHDINELLAKNNDFDKKIENPNLQHLWIHIMNIRKELHYFASLAMGSKEETLLKIIRMLHHDSKLFLHNTIEMHRKELERLLIGLHRDIHFLFVKDKRDFANMIRVAEKIKYDIMSLEREIGWFEHHQKSIREEIEKLYKHKSIINLNGVEFSYEINLMDPLRKGQDRIIMDVLEIPHEVFFSRLDSFMKKVLQSLVNSEMLDFSKVHVNIGSVLGGNAASVARHSDEEIINLNSSWFTKSLIADDVLSISGTIIHELQHLSDSIYLKKRMEFLRDIRREAPALLAELYHRKRILYPNIEWFDNFSFYNHNGPFKSLREFIRYANPPIKEQKGYHRYLVHNASIHMAWTILLEKMNMRYIELNTENLVRIMNNPSASDSIKKVLTIIKSSDERLLIRHYIDACRTTGRISFFSM